MSRYDDLFKEADESFNGAFGKELNELNGLSQAEIDQILPDTEDDLRIYSVLIKVVEEASRKNENIAVLKKRIEELGSVAISIAKKIPTLAALFV